MGLDSIMELLPFFVGVPIFIALARLIFTMLVRAFGKPTVEKYEPIEIDRTSFWNTFDNTLGNMLGGGVSHKRKNDEIDDRLNEIVHDPHFDEKPKRDEAPEETEWYVGDDGELFERKRKR